MRALPDLKAKTDTIESAFVHEKTNVAESEYPSYPVEDPLRLLRRSPVRKIPTDSVEYELEEHLKKKE